MISQAAGAVFLSNSMCLAKSQHLCSSLLATDEHHPALISNGKPVFPECRQLTCTFLIDSKHKYFPTSICLLSPRLNYKFNQTLETHHLDFTQLFYAPYNVGGLNSACCQNLRMIFIQKIPRHISSWKLPKYLALNLIMIRFKSTVFSLRIFHHLLHCSTLKWNNHRAVQAGKTFSENCLLAWVFSY